MAQRSDFPGTRRSKMPTLTKDFFFDGGSTSGLRACSCWRVSSCLRASSFFRAASLSASRTATAPGGLGRRGGPPRGSFLRLTLLALLALLAATFGLRGSLSLGALLVSTTEPIEGLLLSSTGLACFVEASVNRSIDAPCASSASMRATSPNHAAAASGVQLPGPS